MRPDDIAFMRSALALARRAGGQTSPNPLVGAMLVQQGRVIGKGWHHRAGNPHAEIEALDHARAHGKNPKGATLYVTLEPCSTHGRTPPCTDAIIAAGIKRVVIAATDPNSLHAGRAYKLLARAGIKVTTGVLADVAEQLNPAFNHWIVHHTPLVTVKAAMTLDGKIATASGDSKWITGEKARAFGMKLRLCADAILVGINTVLADDPSLTVRSGDKVVMPKRRIILDSRARTPLKAKVITDEFRDFTTIVVTRSAPKTRVAALSKRVNVLTAPERDGHVDLRWLLRRIGKEEVTSLLVEGGGEVNASFLLNKLAHQIAFFYAPKILCGRDSRPAVGGQGIEKLADLLRLIDVQWQRLGTDLLLTARTGG